MGEALTLRRPLKAGLEGSGAVIEVRHGAAVKATAPAEASAIDTVASPS